MLWLEDHRFSDTLFNHDAFKIEGELATDGFRYWRKVFSLLADKLAEKIMDEIKPKDYKKEDVQLALASTFQERKDLLHVGSATVYDPWMNWWCGRWQNKDVHYHIWDDTNYHGGQYIQPVSQSVEKFAYLPAVPQSTDKGNLDDMVKSGTVDLAINVCSKDWDLTGWVSKRQGKQTIEMPHLGYLLHASGLIWIAQARQVKAMNTPGEKWYIFYEHTDVTAKATKYDIEGVEVSIVVDKTDITKSSVTVTYKNMYGHYHSHEPYNTDVTDCKT